MGGKADRRLAVERHLRGAQRFSHYAVAWRQAIRRRGYPHSRPAELGSRLQRESDSGSDGFKKTGRFFDPNAFLLPPTGTFGNLSRGALRGPALFNVDTSLFKRVTLREGLN